MYAVISSQTHASSQPLARRNTVHKVLFIYTWWCEFWRAIQCNFCRTCKLAPISFRFLCHLRAMYTAIFRKSPLSCIKFQTCLKRTRYRDIAALCTRVNFVWQIFCDKWFDRVKGWANFFWQMSLFVCRQWLLDSGKASAQGGKAGKLHKAKNVTQNKARFSSKGKLNYIVCLVSSTFIGHAGEFGWTMENGG